MKSFRSVFFGVFCLLLLSSSSAFGSLVGEWKLEGNFDDSATDVLPNDPAVFTLSTYGTTGVGAFGSPDFQDASLFGDSVIAENLGTALRLHENDADGKFQRIYISESYFGPAPSFNDNWSISMWFCQADTDNNDFLLYLGYWDGFSTGSGGSEFQIQIAPSGVLGVRSYDPSNISMVSEPLAPQQWHQMTFVYSDNSCGTLYVDGELIGVDTSVNLDPAFADNPAGRVHIGGIRRPYKRSWADRSFDGMIDQIMVYDHALTSQEVRQAYNSIASIPEPGSVLIWLGLGTIGLLGWRPWRGCQCP